MNGPHHMVKACKTVLTVLVALFVALRVVAQPLVLAAPEPGMMALCSGGKIVYVSIQTGQPVETDSTSVGEPCPYFGVTAFDLGKGSDLSNHDGLIVSIDPVITSLPAPARGSVAQNTARAPPAHA